MTGPGGDTQGNLMQNNGVYPSKPDYPFSTGVKAKRNSHLTVISKTIRGNSGGGFGVSVKEHSIVNLWRDTSDGTVNYPNTTMPGAENMGYGFQCDGLSSYEGGYFDKYPNGDDADELTGPDGSLDIAESCNGAFFQGARIGNH